MNASVDEQQRQAVADLAAQLLADIDPLVSEMRHIIVSAESSYVDLAVDDLDAALRDNLLSVLSDLAERRDATATFPRRTGRRRAEQGVPLEVVLHSFNLGFRTIWQHMIRLAGERGEADLRVLLGGADVVWETIDAYSTIVVSAYRSAEAQFVWRDEQQRMARFIALLDGQVSGHAGRSEVAAVLGFDVDGLFVVVCSDAPDEDRGAGTQEEWLGQSGFRSSWVPRVEGLIGLVALPDRQALSQLTQRLADRVRGRIGCSPIVQGLRDVASALPLAVLARNTLPIGEVGVVTIDQRPVAALVASAPDDVVERLSSVILGPIDALPTAERDVLLQTLQAWIDKGGSMGDVAGALFCHRNTVRNRLRRIEEVTGKDVQDPRQICELHVALLARDLKRR